ncbi:MAG TPA: TetR/AcrR family transcriptional regulator [Streptosporangiaceae bacterium]
MPDTRDRILDAAAHVMRTRGFARTTTKEIARAAGYSEATLYKHFQDKTDLFLAVPKERLPSLGSTLSALSADADTDPHAGANSADADTATHAGADTRGPADANSAASEGLTTRLTATARGAIAFYEASFPISASVFSEPELLAAHHAAVTGRGGGPQYPVEALARYLRLEQGRGRIRPGADCDAAASLLLGSCFQYAFLRCFAQLPPDPAAAEAHATAIVTTLQAGLQPA